MLLVVGSDRLNTLTVLSSQAVASWVPSGNQASPVTSAVCPRSPVTNSLLVACLSAVWALQCRGAGKQGARQVS